MIRLPIVSLAILFSAFWTSESIAFEAPLAPPRYHVTDLGTLGGGYSYGNGINNSGQVIGTSFVNPSSPIHAFSYDGTLNDLGTLGGSDSGGSGINDSGQITGFASLTGDIAQHAFLYDGTMHDLGTLGGDFSLGYGINDNGQVTGVSQTTDGNQVAFLWTPSTPNGANGTLIDLGTLGGTFSVGQSINNSGQTTGVSSTTGNAETHAFLYDGTMHDLGTLGGTQSEGHGISATGQITGASLTSDNLAYHAFLYDGTMHDLGTLGGTSSYGFGINSSGDVTGYAATTGEVYRAFLYTSGNGMVDLNSLIDPLSGWQLSTAVAINDAGQITGQGLIGGQQHAYLLTPITVPEPASLALLTLGLPLIAWCKPRVLMANRSDC